MSCTSTLLLETCARRRGDLEGRRAEDAESPSGPRPELTRVLLSLSQPETLSSPDWNMDVDDLAEGWCALICSPLAHTLTQSSLCWKVMCLDAHSGGGCRPSVKLTSWTAGISLRPSLTPTSCSTPTVGW